MASNPSQFSSILDTINRYASTNSDRVTALSFMCGTGKSTAIRQKMMQTINKLKEGSDEGLIVITDSIAGLNAYVEPEKDVAAKEFFAANKDKWKIITSENSSKLTQWNDKYPILLITTQRYFQMDHEHIVSLLQTPHYKRPLILIDEAPYLIDGDVLDFHALAYLEGYYLSELVKLDEDVNDNIETAEVLQDETNKFRLKLIAARTTFGSNENMQFCYRYSAPNRQREIQEASCDTYEEISPGEMDENDMQPAENACSIEEELDKDTLEQIKAKGNLRRQTIQSMEAIRHHKKVEDVMARSSKANGTIGKLFKAYQILYSEGGLQYYKGSDNPSDYYANGFYITWNNRDKLTDIPAKIIILDGTADAHPDYQQDYIYLDTCSSYRRDLSHLYIHIVNVSTGKGRLTEELQNINKRSSLFKKIQDDIEQKHHMSPVLFTYKDLEKQFAEAISATAHFGAIKGKNNWSDKHLFAQIGVYQAPEYYYFARYLQLHPELLEPHKGDGIVASKEDITDFTQILKSKEYQQYKNSLLLVDLEQNIFRSSIRDPESTADVHYYIYANTDYFKDLFEMLKKRFNSYNAHVDPSTPITNETDKPKQQRRETRVDLFLKWFNDEFIPSEKDSFRLSEFKDKYNLTGDKIEKMKESPTIKAILKPRKIKGKNAYSRYPQKP